MLMSSANSAIEDLSSANYYYIHVYLFVEEKLALFDSDDVRFYVLVQLNLHSVSSSVMNRATNDNDIAL